MNKQDEIIRTTILKQPLEGLLYDLGLMPEECKSEIANRRKITVEVLRKEIERLKEVFSKILEEDLQKGEVMYHVVKRMRHLAFEVIKEK